MSKWQPIETAPKDGRRIIIGYDDVVAIVKWEGSGWCENDYDNLWHGPDMFFGGPTHWQPLPPPPESE